MQIKFNISEFLDFLYAATIDAVVPIVRSTNNGKAIKSYS
jgi:hypothetical protein